MYQLHKKYYRVLVFVVGILATLAYRAVIILNHYSAFWVEVVWYFGTIGFIWYFAHRWRIETKREKLIEELKLAEKIEADKKLDQKDKEALSYILNGLSTSLASWNYIVIFVSSFLAITYAIYMDISGIGK
jgi:hypothetical protein